MRFFSIRRLHNLKRTQKIDNNITDHNTHSDLVKTGVKTRKGATSMIVTMFTIILFSIITLGFTRLILSEVNQTTNTNLSKSAYDSALAGIEDAKVALLKYHDCLNKGFTASSGDKCGKIISAMQDGIRKQDCSTVSNVLGRTIDDQHGVTIQEVKDSSQDGGSAASKLQAYTCVTLQEDLADYRSTLSSDTRTRIVPLRSDQIQDLKYVTIKWFSDTNYLALLRSGGHLSWDNSDYYLPSGQHSMAPPFISAAFFQSDRNFNLGEFNIASSENSTNRAMLFLKPTDSVKYATEFSAKDVAETFDKNNNHLFPVYCQEGTFFCSVTFEVPNTYRNSTDRNPATTFLLLNLPYGAPETDFSVSLYNSKRESINFTGVQARVDSTGRANDLYRRVESRVELVDTYFPYPEFTIQLNDDKNSSTRKTFYTTINCWTVTDGTKDTCPDFKESSGYSRF